MNNFDEGKIIRTDCLSISDVPSGRMDWSKFSAFALTFDPRMEELTIDDMNEISSNVPRPDHNVKVLRAFLYNWQRIWNNKTYEPPPIFFLEVKSVIDWISSKLINPWQN